jgi:hypothetical protein
MTEPVLDRRFYLEETALLRHALYTISRSKSHEGAVKHAVAALGEHHRRALRALRRIEYRALNEPPVAQPPDDAVALP